MKDCKRYLAELFTISAPLAVGNLGHMLTGAVDVLIAAKHSVNTLAAIAIANSILYTIFILGIGTFSGISIILSNKRGAGEPTKKYFFSSIIISQIIAVLVFVFTLAVIPLTGLMGFEKHLIEPIQTYMYITSFSLFGMYLYQAIKEFLQAHEIVNFPNAVLIGAVILNLFLDIILVFGCGGIPALGVKGLAIATLTVRIFMGLTLLVYTRKLVYSVKNEADKEYMSQVVKTGTPIGLGLLFEFLGFNIITISVARQSGMLSAAHNILNTLSGATFMIPLAISNAIAIKVGYHNGAKNYEEIVNFGKTGTYMSTLLMLVSGGIFFIFPAYFINIFTESSEIHAIAIPIMYVMAIFQVADGLQIALGGMLKGIKRTKEVTQCVLGGYWLFGIPLGFYLAYKEGMLLKGFWIGIAVSLFLIAGAEGIIIKRKLKSLKAEFENEKSNDNNNDNYTRMDIIAECQ